jgi:hypothetical protein
MRLLAAAALAALAFPAAARADCAADAERLAERYGVATELPRAGERPTTTESRGVPPEALSRSGGVIAPPEQGAGRVIAPPPSAAPTMPTAPQIRPEPRAGEVQSGAAKAAQVESLLTAAKAAAERGDQAECARRLEEARALDESG